MKKLISILLASMLALSATVPSFAYEATDDEVEPPSYVEDEPSDIEIDYPHYGYDYDSAELKQICSATIEDDFDDSGIILSLTNKESLKFKDYTVDDFSDIGAVSIKYFWSYENEKASLKNYIEKENIDLNTINPYTTDADELEKIYPVISYHVSMYISLDKSDKLNVLEMIKVLEKRSDILYAEPNYYYYLDPIIPDKDKPYLNPSQEEKVKADLIAYLDWETELTYDDIKIKYYGTMSDGSMLIDYDIINGYSGPVPAIGFINNIRDYEYVSGYTDEVFVYKNSKFYTIKDAYNTGVISDKVLDEIAKVLSFTKVSQNTPSTFDTVKKPEATIDTIPISNGTVQTGQNSTLLYVVLITLVCAGAVFVITKRKNNY